MNNFISKLISLANSGFNFDLLSRIEIINDRIYFSAHQNAELIETLLRFGFEYTGTDKVENFDFYKKDDIHILTKKHK